METKDALKVGRPWAKKEQKILGPFGHSHLFFYCKNLYDKFKLFDASYNRTWKLKYRHF